MYIFLNFNLNTNKIKQMSIFSKNEIQLNVMIYLRCSVESETKTVYLKPFSKNSDYVSERYSMEEILVSSFCLKCISIYYNAYMYFLGKCYRKSILIYNETLELRMVLKKQTRKAEIKIIYNN